MAGRTPLYKEHVQAGAKMVSFGGWDMPIHYGSQISEHHAVRQDKGMFDVSHMTVVDLEGDNTRPFLRYLLANNVDRLTDCGKALYSCMLTPEGTVIDDLIVYYLRNDFFRMVVNAATREKDLTWLRQQADSFSVVVSERDLSMIAVQGPNARQCVLEQLEPEAGKVAKNLKAFFSAQVGDWFIARTGYTGEDGFEIILPADAAVKLWRKLLAHGVSPIGLGARDTLRLEAGMNLYGSDMDETTTPLESALSWTVAWKPEDRDFIGRESLERQRTEGVGDKLVGLVFDGKGVLRSHQKVVVEGIGKGEITSGSFSPTLGCSIALARVPAGVGESCAVEIRGKLVTARVVKPPFVRNGSSCIQP